MRCFVKIDFLLPWPAFLLLFNVNGSSIFYYLGLAGLFAIMIKFCCKVTVNYSLLLFLFCCSLSIIINDIPYQFAPYSRFMVYVLILAMCGPLIINSELMRLRWLLFCLLMKFFSIITCLSFLLLLLGIIPLKNLNETSGGFAGLTGSSMLMAPIAVLSVMYELYRIFSGRRAFLHILTVIIALYVLLLTGSRSAFGGFILALIVFFFLYYRNNLKRFVLYLFFCIVTLFASFPLWKSSIDVMMNKMVIEESMNGDNSRSSKWKNRIYEFTNNPILGVGFFSVDTSKSYADVSETGNIEYGSSWLALLSTTGCLGFFSLFFVYIKSLYTLYKRFYDSVMKSLMCSIGTFFGFHLMFEGYMLSIGNVLNIVFWLSLSIIICMGSFDTKFQEG